MSDDKPTQFDLERYAYHVEIMAAIRQRSEWTRTQMMRRFHQAMALNGAVGLMGIAWVVFVGSGHEFLPFVPVGAALLVWSSVLMLRNRPRRWYRRWNADHPQMGQYLAPDLTD